MIAFDGTIEPIEFKNAEVSIDFSYKANVNPEKPGIYRFVFKNRRFVDMSLDEYGKLEHTLRKIFSEFSDIEEDANFLFESNLFKKDKIVLQFSDQPCDRLDTVESSDNIWFSIRRMIKTFTAAIKLHRLNGMSWSDISTLEKEILEMYKTQLVVNFINQDSSEKYYYESDYDYYLLKQFFWKIA